MSATFDFFAGCMGGVAGVVAGHPLDTVKVRLQTQHQGGAAQYRGTFDCIGQMVKREGVAGLYKGMSSPLASLSAINAIVFGVHGTLRRTFFERPESLRAHFYAGCAAGLAQSIIAGPSERLKLLVQIQQDSAHSKFSSPYDALRHTLKENGSRSLFRGSLATMVRDCPAFGIYFGSYEWMVRNMSKDGKSGGLNGAQLLLAGGTAGMVSWLFNYPTDVIKTRFQADPSYKGYMDCIARTYVAGGYRAFFVGMGPTLLRAFPSNAATFFTVEWTYRLFLRNEVIAPNVAPSTNVLDLGTNRRKESSTVSPADMFLFNWHFILPEAGSTSLDPLLHGCRLL